jgi:hypothetical protein
MPQRYCRFQSLSRTEEQNGAKILMVLAALNLPSHKEADQIVRVVTDAIVSSRREHYDRRVHPSAREFHYRC